uniref:Putative tir domain protein n=1 Tax=Tabanus bromius TaxID=304241 RepID=A0A0K8TL98_TABBR
MEVNIEDVPVKVLRYQSRQQLSKHLNSQKVLLSENGLPRDWRGIAHLAGCKHDLALERDPDPMAKVLKLWSEEQGESATIGQLRKFLELIDRYDVEEDLSQAMEEDVVFFSNTTRNTPQEIPDTSVISADSCVITNDDITRLQQGQGPQKYDAFVLFADEDIDFADELIERMQNFGLKLCVKERDLLGGIPFEHEAIMRLISERCNRLVIVVSPNFFRSPANSFFVSYAAALGIEQRRRKIVPCVYRACELPPTLSFYFLLYYERSGRFWNFWDKLRDSLQATVIKHPEASNFSIPAIASINDHEIEKKQVCPFKVDEKKLNQSPKVDTLRSKCDEELQKLKYCSNKEQMLTESQHSVSKQVDESNDNKEKTVDTNCTISLKRKWYEKILFSTSQKHRPKKTKNKKTKGTCKKVGLEDC